MSMPFIENQVISKANENIQTNFCSVRDSQISCLHDMGLRSLSVRLTTQAMKCVVLYLFEIF